ncbi:hypothetical protein Cci01nite_44670 [Catellatospora citrea]|uniref:Uncharacterized protein n=2 Tax=Catellatospora citrea TaxID=53366 RepID=A0A8J3P0F5_9ACTN|nr:hypothetical protein Cci01nite_44670 [Catellatospora citrea]
MVPGPRGSAGFLPYPLSLGARMTTEPQQPVDDDTTAEPAPDPQPAPPARTWSRPSAGTLAALLIAFLLGGLVCGGLGLAAGLMAGHHRGHHDFGRHDFDRHERGPWGGGLDRDERVRPEQRLRDQELKRQLLERLRQRGFEGQPMPWPFPPNTLPDGGVPVPVPPVAPTAAASPAAPTATP